MKNVTQITFDSNNDEAYFSWDGETVISHSSRNGYASDKIWNMNVYGSDKRMVSTDHRAHVDPFFFPKNMFIFASTTLLPDTCPLKPEISRGARYLSPLYPYDIFTITIAG